jgi:hypothetical protein
LNETEHASKARSRVAPGLLMKARLVRTMTGLIN